MGQLLDHVFRRQKTIEAMKQSLLQPLFDFVRRYRKAHYQFWREEFGENCEEKEIELSFNHSLVGKFNTQLHKLVRCLYLYTFNGGKYDFVLLHKFL